MISNSYNLDQTVRSVPTEESKSSVIPELKGQGRIDSIDMLRGIVMIIMAIDHVRLYLHYDSQLFSPTDLEHTTVPIFMTRFITHLCAPTFILLAGTSIYFMSQRKSPVELSIFLVTRGLWLIFLQMTLIRFAWNFDPILHYNSSNIISTIGFCMIALAGLIHLGTKAVLIVSLTMILGHNALDNVSFEDGSMVDLLWSFVHVRKHYELGNNFSFLFLYPLVPWIGVMGLGYCIGHYYESGFAPARRSRLLFIIGMSCLFAFGILRLFNLYGDPVRWSVQTQPVMTILSFFNVEKYPPSLLYLCLMLGVGFILLAVMSRAKRLPLKWVIVFGKVPMFYYVAHIFLIHLGAMMLVMIAGYSWRTMVFIGPTATASTSIRGVFGLNLGYLYLFWLAIILLLYPLCNAWNKFKKKNADKWWVSYV